MSALSGGTPRASSLVAEVNGERYLVATPEQAGQLSARSWSVQRVTDQGAELEEFRISIADFSQGSGFAFEGIPGTYDRADGWDCSAPGKPATWPRRATGDPITTVDYRGWLLFHGTYLYALRGRYAAKYAVDDTAGATWPIIELHDFGSGRVVAGRPAIFKGKAYVPLRDGSGGALAVFHELTTVATTTVETQTIVISGTPTSGTYTVTFDGKTTAAIAYNADQATVQAALRTIAGLEAVTVVTTGSVPNYTHTVTMTGVGASLTGTSPPQMTSTDSMSGGAHAIAHNTTSAGVSDTWTAGPSGKEARCFVVWQNKLVRANANTVSSVSGDPMTGGDWSATNDVGDSGRSITDLGVYPNGILLVGKTNGLWSFDESLNTNNETPDLEEVVDDNQCIGMRYTNGYMLVPHKEGLIRWRPGAWQIVGPEQDGALEGELTRGWGRVASIAPFGKQTFFAINDGYHSSAAIGSFRPGTERRSPLVPHMHHETSPGTFEAVAILSSANEPATAKTPSTITDDNAVGTITWSNPSNAGASDDTYATAAAGTSHYLKALSPQPNVPTNATIEGVLVEIEVSAAPSASPAFRAEAHGSGTTSSAFSVTKPAGTTDGDVLIVAIDGGGGLWTDVTPPAGWEKIVDYQGGSSDGYLIVFWKVAASEGASWTFTPVGGSETYQYVALAYSGASTVEAYSSGDGGENSTSHVVNPPSATTPNTTLVALLSGGATRTFTPPAGMTERYDAGASPGLVAADKALTDAGDPGNQTFTSSGLCWTNYGAVIIRGDTSVSENILKLVKGGAIVGDNKAISWEWPILNDGFIPVLHGGSSDLWGTTLTPDDVNASDFGVVLSVTVTSGTARVDHIRMTVYYSVPGVSDPAPFLAALHVDSTRTIATPWIYSLPRAGMEVANDPNVAKARDDAVLYTSRYYRPGRNEQKTWDRVEFWLTASPEVNTPGFEVWASVDEATAIQLQDADGDAATFLTTGYHRAYFPRTSAAVGHYVQLQPTIPVASGDEVDVAASFRDMALLGSWRPLTTEVIQATFILGAGEFEDRTSMRRTPRQQLAELEALCGPNASPIAFRDPQGRTGYATLTALQWREFQFKGQETSTLVAQCQLRKVYAE